MKSFSTVRDTWRGTQSYMEKRRGRMGIEVTRRRRGGIKRGESKLASKHFTMCSQQSGSLRDVQNYREKRRRRKETEVAMEIKGRTKKRLADPANNKFPNCSPQSGTHKEIHRVE